tara:strand:- start:243 stop:506 length:264 start_codon:yes stop_codon:yes gene_type:complete
LTVDEDQNYGKKYGRTWTTEDLKSKVRKVEVLNFAKRKKAVLKDDITEDWSPYSDRALKDYLTGYYAACDDLHKWVMGQYEEEDGKR